MVSAYCDTNVIVQLVLSFDKGEHLPPKQEIALELYGELLDKKFEWIFSNYLIFEMRDVLTKLFYEVRCIAAGFAFTAERHDITEDFVKKITKEDIRKIEDVVVAIKDSAKRKNYKVSFKKVTELQRKGFSSYDIFHLINAEKSNCDYFITWDNDLLKINDIKKKGKREFKIIVLKPETFLEKLDGKQNKSRQDSSNKAKTNSKSVINSTN